MNRILFALMVGGLCAAAPARAEVDAFLCIQGVTGESNDSGFPTCSPVYNASEAMFIEAGGPETRDVRFTKFLDSASRTMRQAMLAGMVLPTTTLNFRHPSANAATDVFASIVITQPRVTSMATSFGGDRPTESVSLTGRRLQYMYRRQNLDGSLAPATYLCWDLATEAVTTSQCP